MKKTLLSLAAIALAWGVMGASYALTISDLFSNGDPLVDDAYAQLLNNYDAWWYTEASITACENAEDGITITSPIVTDEMMYEAPEYRIFVSPYRVEQLRSWDGSIDPSRIVMKKFKREWTATEFTVNLWLSDGLAADTPYYAFISPVDEYDGVWAPSQEFCFQISQNICMLDACDTFESIVNPAPIEPENNEENVNPEDIIGNEEWEEGVHGAACVWMDLAHVSHTVRWDKLSLTWTAVDWNEVDIAIFNPDEEIYEKLATVKMSDEKYVYTMRWNGEQNFLLTTSCGELRYKADAAMGEPQKDPEIVTPATGPAENILYIAIAAIVIYGAYTIFFRKSENN